MPAFKSNQRTTPRTTGEPLAPNGGARWPTLAVECETPDLRRIVGFVAIIGTPLHDGAQIAPQFLIAGRPTKYQPLWKSVAAQIGVQHKGVRLRTIGIFPLGLVENVDLLDDDPRSQKEKYCAPGPLKPA